MSDKYLPISIYNFQESFDSASLSSNHKNALILSAILPGTGEYYLGHKYRAFLFWGIEAIALGTWYSYSKEGENLQNKYRQYASEHWSMARWLKDYYKWKNTSIDSIFIEPNGGYPEIWDNHHYINFEWGKNRNIITSTSDEFINIFSDLCCYNYDIDVVEDFLLDGNYKIVNDHNFYENIGKYDLFFAGWDDNDSLFVIIKEDGGELIAMSPHKKFYRELWTSSNEDYYLMAKYAISILTVNHVASMIDILILSKLSELTGKKVEIEQSFGLLNNSNSAEIKFKFDWD